MTPTPPAQEIKLPRWSLKVGDWRYDLPTHAEASDGYWTPWHLAHAALVASGQAHDDTARGFNIYQQEAEKRAARLTEQLATETQWRKDEQTRADLATTANAEAQARLDAETQAHARQLAAIRTRMGCFTEPHVSRFCELWTGGCNVRHRDETQARQEAEALFRICLTMKSAERAARQQAERIAEAHRQDSETLDELEAAGYPTIRDAAAGFAGLRSKLQQAERDLAAWRQWAVDEADAHPDEPSDDFRQTLTDTINAEHERAEQAERARDEWKDSEREISEAYLRVRSLLGAWDTTHGGANRYAVVERKIADLLAHLTAAEQARAQAEQERDESRQALENDAADLWRVTTAIKDVIRNRSWVTESRGSYEWDDDRYRDETRLAFDEVRKLIAECQHPAQRRFHEIVGHQPAPMQKMRVRAERAEASLASLRTALEAAGEAIHSEYCTAKHHAKCVAVTEALAPTEP